MRSTNRNLIPRCRAALSAVVLAVASMTLSASPSVGATSEWFEHEHGAARLISSNAGAGSAQTIDLGLQFRMKPGWKVYWRSPGDTGFPPQVSWVGSTNFAGATMSWPAPERFSILGLETLGYKKEVVFPISAEVFERGKAVDLAARVRFLTCDEICVPYETNLTLNLPAGRDLNTPASGTIATWQSRVPMDVTRLAASAPLAIERAEIAGSGEDQTLIVRVTGKEALSAPDLFVEGPVDYGFKKPVVQIASVGNQALMRIGIHAPERPDARLAGETVTLTLVDGDRAVERKVTLERASSTATAFPGSNPGGDGMGYGFLSIIGFALLGGLILNLMPCVLPVLSIKLLTVVSHGGEVPGRIRVGFLASSAGIIACFLLLGTVAVGLQSAGLAAGWGIQFQQPAFLAFMIAIITLFACNMWGLFEIRLPGAVADAAVNVDMIVQNVSKDGAATDMTFTVSRSEFDRSVDVLTGLKAQLGYTELRSDAKVAKVSVVGLGMRSQPGVAKTMFKTLAERGINIEVISTSEIKVSVLIDAEYTELAVRALHAAFGLDRDDED